MVNLPPEIIQRIKEYIPKDKDQFYTPIETAKKCYEIFLNIIDNLREKYSENDKVCEMIFIVDHNHKYPNGD